MIYIMSSSVAVRRSRRRVVRRRRIPMRRKFRLSRALKIRRNRLQATVHKFTRWTDATTIYNAGGGSFSGAYGIHVGNSAGVTVSSNANYFLINAPANATSFVSVSIGAMLRGLPSSTEFGMLFDKYRIHGFSVHLNPGYNTFTYGLTQIPIIHSVVDYDDYLVTSADAGGVNALRQYLSYKTNPLDKHWSRYVRRPQIQQSGFTYSGASPQAAGLTVSSRKYIDMAYLDVAHNSLKFIIEVNNPTGSAVDMQYKFEMKYYLTCIAPR